MDSSMTAKLFMYTAPTTIVSANTHAFRFKVDLNRYRYWRWYSWRFKNETRLVGLETGLYFQNISTERGPWREAAFLSKASSVNLGYKEGDREIKTNDDTAISTPDTKTYIETNSYNLPSYNRQQIINGIWLWQGFNTRRVKHGADYYPGPKLGLIAELENIAALSNDYDDNYDSEYSRFSARFGLSYYPMKQLHLSASVQGAFEEDENDNETDSAAIKRGIGMRF